MMTMAMISPSRREVSPAEQFRWSPRLVPPRFRFVAAEFRPVSLPMIFSRVKAFIYQKMATGGLSGGPPSVHEGGGRAPLPHGPPVGSLVAIFCYMKSFVRKK